MNDSQQMMVEIAQLESWLRSWPEPVLPPECRQHVQQAVRAMLPEEAAEDQPRLALSTAARQKLHDRVQETLQQQAARPQHRVLWGARWWATAAAAAIALMGWWWWPASTNPGNKSAPAAFEQLLAWADDQELQNLEQDLQDIEVRSVTIEVMMDLDDAEMLQDLQRWSIPNYFETENSDYQGV
ncbi:MAG: hypothetical protein HJJLKODD_00071 [Phycisphaerae bacterium]|nr:hypothetical protein [Phycisphaerae bacterium]